jgi:hypothetical protein
MLGSAVYGSAKWMGQGARNSFSSCDRIDQDAVLYELSWELAGQQKSSICFNKVNYCI